VRVRKAGFALWLLGLSAAASINAQTRLEIDQIDLCSYYGERIEGDIYGFEADQEAVGIIEEIMRRTILPQNFSIEAASVPNAAAVIRGGKRMILYSQTFLHDLEQKAGTGWAAKSILAHEIGHHLAGHTLAEGGSRPESELEADKFSGGMLYRMGSSLEDAKAAMEIAGSVSGSATHPPKQVRLSAIHNGWIAARDQEGAPASAPQVSSARQQPDPLSIDREVPEQEAPLPSTLPTEIDIGGRWTTSFTSTLQLTPTGESEEGKSYSVAEHNFLGVHVGQGVALLQGDVLSVQLVSAYVPVVCQLVLQGRQMNGHCNGSPTSLLRQD